MSSNQETTSKQSLVQSDNTLESSEIITDKNNETNNKKQSISTAQKQLLILAKQFVLDGALIPDDKQMPIEDRAIRRQRVYHLRKQQNLETIIQKSLGYCPSSSSAKADPDWFSQFTSLAEDVSNSTMQDLWAKILAGEVSQPGTFSLKSLAIFKSLSITDAKLLAKVCSLAVKDSTRKNTRIISGAYKTPGLLNLLSKNKASKVNLNQCGVTYTELLSLAENHLIFIQETESNEFNKGEKINFNFNGESLTLTATKNQCILNFYKFTPMGSELALLISDNPNKEFLSLLKSSLQSHFLVSSS